MQEKSKSYFSRLLQTVDSLYKNGKTILPKREFIFSALELTPLKEVKCVIIGQDPYPNKIDATGLAFSTNGRIPRSLQNIFTELVNDIGCIYPHCGSLVRWAKEGVLLLNTLLTTEEGKSLAHANIGWEIFTDALISAICKENQNTVFILWGAYARAKLQVINTKTNLVIISSHPSPRSANSGFFGSRPFSKANSYLKQFNKEINWDLERKVENMEVNFQKAVDMSKTGVRIVITGELAIVYSAKGELEYKAREIGDYVLLESDKLTSLKILKSLVHYVQLAEEEVTATSIEESLVDEVVMKVDSVHEPVSSVYEFGVTEDGNLCIVVDAYKLITEFNVREFYGYFNGILEKTEVRKLLCYITATTVLKYNSMNVLEIIPQDKLYLTKLDVQALKIEKIIIDLESMNYLTSAPVTQIRPKADTVNKIVADYRIDEIGVCMYAVRTDTSVSDEEDRISVVETQESISVLVQDSHGDVLGTSITIESMSSVIDVVTSVDERVAEMAVEALVYDALSDAGWNAFELEQSASDITKFVKEYVGYF